MTQSFLFKTLAFEDWKPSQSADDLIPTELERLRIVAKAKFGAVVKRDHDNAAIVEWTTHEAYGRRLEKIPQFRNALKSGQPFEVEVRGNLKGFIVGIPIAEDDNLLRFTVFFCNRPSFFRPRMSARDLSVLKALLLDRISNVGGRQDRLVHASISALLSEKLPADPFQTTLELLLKLFQCDQGTIWEYHDNSQYNEPSYLTLEGLGNQAVEKYRYNCLKEPLGLVWQALAPNSPQYILRTDTTLAELVNKDAKEEYTNKPVVLIRLEAGNTIYGVACLTGVKPLDVDNLTPAFAMFQNIAALEIHNKRLERKNRILQKVSEIIPTVATTTTEACQATAHKLRELLEVETVSVFLRPDGQKNLHFVAHSVAPEATDTEWLTQFEQSETGGLHKVMADSLVARIVGEKKPMLCNELTKHPFTNKQLKANESTERYAWIGVPINREGHCIGVLCCGGKRTTITGRVLNYIFDSFDVFVLEDAARILSPILDAIDNFSSLESVNRRLELSERLREHEMRAPLAAISWNAGFVLQYLDDSGATSKQRRLREIVSDSEMVTFLLRDPRVPKNAAFHGGLRYLSIRDLINDLVQFLQRQIEARSRLERNRVAGAVDSEMSVLPFMKIEFQGSAPKTLLSKFLIQRALYNMGINAVKYGSPNGTLAIRLSEHGESITIEFIDDGIGIDPGDAPYIFDEGFRGRNTEGRSGDGLGLRITKEIIEAHGGEIVLISARTPTMFRVTLPIVRPNALREATSHPSILRMDKPTKVRR